MKLQIEKIVIMAIIVLSASLSARAGSEDRIVQLPVAKDPTISFRIVFNAGAQFDPKGREGLSYITAQLLSEGSTNSNSYEQILKKLFPLASSFAVSPGREVTVFTGRTHKDNLKDYYDLFIQQILNPAFLKKELERVKSDALNYLENELKYSSDEELGKAVLYGTIYAGTPYAHPEEGHISGLKSITIEDVKNFYASYYNKNNFTLGIGGGYEQPLVDQLWNDLQHLPEGGLMERPEVRPEPVEGYKMVMVDKKTSATAISIGFPIELLRGERDWYALAIANSWLGEHRNSSSHLYQVIREKRGLNYGDYSYIENFPRGGRRQMPPVNVPRKSQIFEIWIRPVPNETAHFALRAALREFTKLVENGMTAEEFEITRRFLKSYVLHYAPTTSLRLGYALDDKFYRVSQSHLELFRKMMDGITLEEVNAAIRKHLQTNQMVISIICTDAEALSRNISANVQSPITYQSPKSPSILAEDKEIAVFNIPIREDQIKILTLEMLFNE